VARVGSALVYDDVHYIDKDSARAPKIPFTSTIPTPSTTVCAEKY
jgi:hypothetical protein